MELVVIKWMDGEPVFEALLDLMSYKCSKKCIVPRCVCLANGQKCTDMCSLHGCEVQVQSNEDDDGTLLEELDDFEEN